MTSRLKWIGKAHPESGGLTVNGQSYVVTGNSLTSKRSICLPMELGSGLNATFDDESTCTAPTAMLTLAPESCALCPADVNGNGAIDVSDVLDGVVRIRM